MERKKKQFFTREFKVQALELAGQIGSTMEAPPIDLGYNQIESGLGNASWVTITLVKPELLPRPWRQEGDQEIEKAGL